MLELDKIGLNYGTDKSSKLHNYLCFYERSLDQYSNKQFTLMELGVGPENNKGKSLLTWRDFFPMAQIVGVDIRPDAKDVETDRIKVEIGDCGNPTFSFESLFPHVPSGGIYLCEDLGTSFPPASDKKAWSDHHEDAVNYFLRMVSLSIGGGISNHSSDQHLVSATQKALSKMISEVVAFKGIVGFIKK